jgi:putative salt-induced outer membrane protein YdiY
MKPTSHLTLVIACWLAAGHIFAQNSTANDELARLRADLEAARRENAALADQNQKARQQIQSLNQEVATLKGAPEKVAANDEAAEKLKNPWKTEIAAGGNYSTGNTSSYRTNLGFKAVRETANDQLSLALTGEYGKTSGDLDAERLLAEGNYRRNIEEQLYWLANGSFLHDGVSGLDYRTTIGPGLGYYFIKNDAITFLLEGGPAYVWERQEGKAGTSSVRGRVAQEFDWKFTPNAKLFERWEFLDNLQNVQDWVTTLEGGVETSITKTISLRLSGRYQYDNNPAEDRKRSDFTALGALVYKFE